MNPAEEADICRVCRSEATPDKPLYHPCLCLGSIEFVHQECLLQWLKHSRKDYCELCKHRFAFTPVYSPDMPARLPVKDICMGVFSIIGTAIKFSFHFILVAFGWLGVVPLTACRLYNCLFAGTVNAVIMLPFDMISTKNVLADCVQGCFVVACSAGSFIGLIWLREQLVNGGAPHWLEPNQQPEAPNQPQGPAQANEVPGVEDGAAAAAAAAAAAGGVGAQHPAVPAADELAPVNPHDAGNQGDQAELDIGEEEGNEEAGEDADANNEGQDLNWNAMEWEQAAEELTWQRMLGLDGSLVFIEHVVWVVSLNMLFILVFAFCPYHIGYFSVVGLGLEDYINASHFEGLITTIMGYIVLAGSLLLCYVFASLVNFQRSRRMMGSCYVAVKVVLLIVVEIGLFPLICGWWLDICSLEMFGATLKDREQGFYAAPRTIMFVHWLIGMVYVFYFTSFILLAREVLRPGVLWFLRNINEPDFNPIYEMIHQPIYKHLWRFLSSLVFFGSIVLLMVWLPIEVIKEFFPTVFPYNVMLYREAPISELSMELLLLQVVLPALLEQGEARHWVKQAIHAWTFTMGHVLDLHSYLLGGFDRSYYLPFNPNNDRIHVMGEWRQIASLGGPIGFPLYHRPASFPLKIILLVVFLLVSMFLTSMICFTLPGRWLTSLWVGSTVIHELYTAACGLYVYWLLVRGATALIFWLPLGYSFMLHVQEWAVSIGKTLVVTVVLAGIMPLLLGVFVELVIMAPLRVPLDQTPFFYCCQNWAAGLLHSQIIAGITLLGPNWWFKTIIEQIYANGFQNVDLHLNLGVLAVPLICILLLSLCVPYTISSVSALLLGLQPEMQTLVERRVYPFMLITAILGLILLDQIRKLTRLYDRVKNEKYLIGHRLVNYENRDAHSASP